MITYAGITILLIKAASDYLQPIKTEQKTQDFLPLKEVFATALPSFIDQKPAQEYLQTIEKSELLYISRKDFYSLTERFPGFAKIYLEILELGFIVAQKRIYGFQGFDAMEKVKWIIQHQPKVYSEFPIKWQHPI